MASTDPSVAPKERVNIVYKAQIGDAQVETELPLKILMVGDYTGRHDDTAVEDRKPINIDKENFNEVMAKQDLEIAVQVPDQLSGEKDSSLNERCRISSCSASICMRTFVSAKGKPYCV